jgi:hypothetical protein
VVLDFRAVNLKSLPDRYCVKEVRECLDEVGKARSVIFSRCNLTLGFWQQSLQEKSRQYTSFSVPGKGARYQEGHSDGITGLAGKVRKTDGLLHDGG